MMPPPMITTSRVFSLELTDLFYQWGSDDGFCGGVNSPPTWSLKGWRPKGLRYTRRKALASDAGARSRR